MMKQINFLTIITLLAFSLFSCNKGDDTAPIIEPLDDNSLPSAAILGVEVMEKTDDRLKFRMNIAVFRDSENIEENLNASAFAIDSLQIAGYHSGFANDLTNRVQGGKAGNYSALLLMDQSGSISSTDPENYRLDAARIFSLNLGANNNVALWSFSGSNYKAILDFTTDTANVIREIENLRDKEGGSTPLYRSQYEAITYTKGNSNKANKAVLTFTDGQNSGSGNSEEVVNHAKSQGITLYNIGLGDVSTDLLLQQAVATKGAFMYAKDAKQLISFFGNLDKLLSHTATYYQTEWTVRSKSGEKPFQGQGQIKHEVKVTFPFGGQISVPFSFSYQ
ncbi:vWA domain-containing protein [Albibacterium indicum]|uniref:vWA domain-containing protein n=1 Tax=Albibacterium indicum TaxID=2292082 RepID=UPI000E53B8C6|nr:vWA domain-containing protein [Pedobacter indicus]